MDKTTDSTMGLRLPETVYPPREDTLLMINSLMGPLDGCGQALEIGSGSGAVSISLAEKGWDVTAIDVNPMAVVATHANAQEKGGHEVNCIEGSFDEIPLLRRGMFDLIVWNLPYLGIPPEPPTLEAIEESSMIDTGSGGWASELRKYLVENPSMLSPDGAVILLYRTNPSSPSDPQAWIRSGWATRSLSSLYIGGERLEVIAHWRQGSNKDPYHLTTTNSTMNYDFPKKHRFERVCTDNQTSGRGRIGAKWDTDPEGVAGTWRIDGMQGLSPGILQIGLGSILASSFNMQLKWPNDMVDGAYRKCGGVLTTLEKDGSIKVGVGINRDARNIPAVATAGWADSMPGLTKDMAVEIADASIASVLDDHPLLGNLTSENIRIDAWKTLSKTLSMGFTAIFDEKEMRPTGIGPNGELVLSDNSDFYSVTDIEKVRWKTSGP